MIIKVRTFVNVTMYPKNNNIVIKKKEKKFYKKNEIITKEK
jgi:hypothetical protein